MSSSNTVVELFFPLESILSSGLIIGWNISKFKSCILTIIPSSSICLNTIINVLNKLNQKELSKYCTYPIILGWYQTNDSIYPSIEIEEYKQVSNFWINIDDTIINTTSTIASIYNDKKISNLENNQIKLPTLKDIYCCNSRYKGVCHIIFYNRPSKSNYISVTPYTYDIDIDKDTKITDLDFIIRQINISSFIGASITNILNDQNNNTNTISTSRSSPPLIEEKGNDSNEDKEDKETVSSTKGNKNILLTLLLFPIRLLFLLFYFYSNMFHYIASKNLPFTQFNLADHSLFFRQFLRKLNEIETWPHLYVKTLQKYNYDESSSEAYMQLWSSVSRTAVDVVSGVICCSLLYYFSAGVLTELHNFGQLLHIDVMQNLVRWLMEQPAGAKLNHNLTHALGNSVLLFLDLWNSLTTLVTPFEPYIVQIFGVASILGVTFGSALLLDGLTILTFHITLIHSFFLVTYVWSLSWLSSLWKLFRGKKHNILRKRIDNCDYNLDQLFMGTLLFATIFFLFPTFGIYYISFGIIALIITVVQAFIYVIFVFFNSFPFFGVLVHFLDRNKLPGGIWFELLPNVSPDKSITNSNSSNSLSSLKSLPPLIIKPLTRNSSEVDFKSSSENSSVAEFIPVIKTRLHNAFGQSSYASYMLLHTRGISLGSLFYEFKSVLTKLLSHYTPNVLFGALLSGRRFPSRPQVFNITKNPESAAEFWKFLDSYL